MEVGCDDLPATLKEVLVYLAKLVYRQRSCISCKHEPSLPLLYHGSQIVIAFMVKKKFDFIFCVLNLTTLPFFITYDFIFADNLEEIFGEDAIESVWKFYYSTR
jgi:hypothetical protein